MKSNFASPVHPCLQAVFIRTRTPRGHFRRSSVDIVDLSGDLAAGSNVIITLWWVVHLITDTICKVHEDDVTWTCLPPLYQRHLKMWWTFLGLDQRCSARNHRWGRRSGAESPPAPHHLRCLGHLSPLPQQVRERQKSYNVPTHTHTHTHTRQHSPR